MSCDPNKHGFQKAWSVSHPPGHSGVGMKVFSRSARVPKLHTNAKEVNSRKNKLCSSIWLAAVQSEDIPHRRYKIRRIDYILHFWGQAKKWIWQRKTLFLSSFFLFFPFLHTIERLHLQKEWTFQKALKSSSARIGMASQQIFFKTAHPFCVYSAWMNNSTEGWIYSAYTMCWPRSCGVCRTSGWCMGPGWDLPLVRGHMGDHRWRRTEGCAPKQGWE